MPMTYTTDIQAATVRAKLRALIDAVVEAMIDGDEALDRREPEPLAYEDGFTVSMCASLSFYDSTGTGTPLLDARIARAEDAQAAEWARQYPERAPLFDSDHPDAEGWKDVALDGEDVWARVEITRDGGDVVFASCFTDEVNAPIGIEYRERMAEDAFMALDGPELESLAQRVAEGPYLSLITLQNSGGLWTAWLGTADGKVAHFSTSGHDSEDAARLAVERAARSV